MSDDDTYTYRGRSPVEPVRCLTPREEAHLVSHIRKFRGALARRDAAWIVAIRETGTRIGAFAALRVQDAEEALRSRYLVLRPETMKGRRGHSVYLNRRARSAFEELLRVRRSMGCGDSDPAAPLVVSRHGRGLAVRSYQHRMRVWCRSAGIEVPASPHWLRHGRAASLVRGSTATNPLLVAQAVLGHANVATTARYTRPRRDEIERALEEG